MDEIDDSALGDVTAMNRIGLAMIGFLAAGALAVIWWVARR